MIDQVLKLTRPLIVFDLETTGLDPEQARIVELGFQAWYHDGRPMKEYRTLVRPGVPIPNETVHHVSETLVNSCATCAEPLVKHTDILQGDDGKDYPALNGHLFKQWPTFKQLAPHLTKGFSDCDYAGKNVRYDLRVMAAEMNRAGLQWTFRGARIIDADRLEQLGEPRTLSALYKKHTGKTLEGAHQALNDVRGTTELIVCQLQRYTMLPRDLDLLHRLQWKDEWLDGDGKFKMVDGVPTCTFGKHKGTPMKDVPKDYYEWILKPDVTMSAEVKALARDAVAGRFPE